MILSASRRCDLPAHYADWFFNRMREGYALVRNPMNPHQVSWVELKRETVECIVFWTKNPRPMLEKLSLIADYPFYFQYTLNSYESDIEPGLPDRSERLDAFRRLSRMIGPERVIWRYDPILLCDDYPIERQIAEFSRIAGQLNGYAEKVIISFVDFYAKITNRMRALGIAPLDAEQKLALACGLSRAARENGLLIESCAEDIDLSEYAISHARCIDDRLIGRITGSKPDAKKDKHQRLACGCVASVDIGAYNCCAHGCAYCYANDGAARVTKNIAAHDPHSPLLIGGIQADDNVYKRLSTGRVAVHQINMFGDKDHDDF